MGSHWISAYSNFFGKILVSPTTSLVAPSAPRGSPETTAETSTTTTSPITTHIILPWAAPSISRTLLE